MSDTYKEKGFLSTEINTFSKGVSIEFAAEFEASESLSDQAHKLIIDFPEGLETAWIIATVVFLERTVRACQGSILLCRSGLVQEAQVLVRAAFETLFVGAALVRDGDKVYAKLASSADFEDAKQANGMLKTPSGELSDEQISILREVIDRAQLGAAKYPLYQAAETAGLLHLYQTVYRGLSSLASHATFRSLDRSFVEEGEGYSLIMGPSATQLSFTLGLARTCLSETIKCLRTVADAKLTQ